MTNDFRDLESACGIDLAREPSFRLGKIEVRPALRQLVREADGAEEMVEPRVMQVLVALARADGGIVTRDALIRDCWAGRVVGEDAINRALSRVRRLSEGIGAGAFALETVTKVGYRLLRAGEADETRRAAAAASGGTRRQWLVGGLATAGIAAVGGALLLPRGRTDPLAPGTEAMMQQAALVLGQDTREGHNQAIALCQRVVAANPDYADGWGWLGYVYAIAALHRPQAESDRLRSRAAAAGRRALTLEPDNGLGLAALAVAAFERGRWLETERALSSALDHHPDQGRLLFAMVGLLTSVGRGRDALPLMERAERALPEAPDRFFYRINLLWSLDRLEETDRAMEQAASLFPTHFAIWFIRFYILMFSGRASAAIAMAEDKALRPSGIRDAEVESVVRVARAMQGRKREEIDAVVTEQLARAHLGCGHAENAMQFAASLGRLDTAFAIAEAYYFNRGFAVPELRFTEEQGAYTPLHARLTGVLFKPSTRAMRADPRFDRLVGELGLKSYWKASGSRPDYLT